jgi:hypothetical protein
VINPDLTGKGKLFETFFATPFLWLILSMLTFLGLKKWYESHMLHFTKFEVGKWNNANLILDAKILSKPRFEDYLAQKQATKQTVIHPEPTAANHHYMTWTGTFPPSFAMSFSRFSCATLLFF